MGTPSISNPTFDNSFRDQELIENNSYYGNPSRNNYRNQNYGNINALQNNQSCSDSHMKTHESQPLVNGQRWRENERGRNDGHMKMHESQSRAPSNQNSHSHAHGQELLENNSYYGNPVSK